MLGSFLFFAEPIIIFAHANSISQPRLPERRLGLLGLLVVTSWRLCVCVCKNVQIIIFKNDNISPLVREGDECQVCARLYTCLFESSLMLPGRCLFYFCLALLWSVINTAASDPVQVGSYHFFPQNLPAASCLISE